MFEVQARVVSELHRIAQHHSGGMIAAEDAARLGAP